jgi:hypothetical protein
MHASATACETRRKLERKLYKLTETIDTIHRHKGKNEKTAFIIWKEGGCSIDTCHSNNTSDTMKLVLVKQTGECSLLSSHMWQIISSCQSKQINPTDFSWRQHRNAFVYTGDVMRCSRVAGIKSVTLEQYVFRGSLGYFDFYRAPSTTRPSIDFQRSKDGKWLLHCNSQHLTDERVK